MNCWKTTDGRIDISAMKIGLQSIWPNRFLPFFIYLVAGIVVVWAGFKLLDRTRHLKFYHSYLCEWQKTIISASAKDIQFPRFSQDNHYAYMDELVVLLKRRAIAVPSSNTPKPYLFHIREKEGKEVNQIFILCFENRIIVYGLSKELFDMLDKTIDGNHQQQSGKFKGKLQRDNRHYAATWEI